MTKVTIKVERDEPRVARETYSVEQTHWAADGTAIFTVFSSRHGGDNVLTDVSLQSAMRGVAELVAETTDPAVIFDHDCGKGEYCPQHGKEFNRL